MSVGMNDLAMDWYFAEERKNVVYDLQALKRELPEVQRLDCKVLSTAEQAANPGATACLRITLMSGVVLNAFVMEMPENTGQMIAIVRRRIVELAHEDLEPPKPAADVSEIDVDAMDEVERLMEKL